MKNKIIVTILILLLSLILYYMGNCKFDLIVLIITIIVGIVFLLVYRKLQKDNENLCNELIKNE